MMTYILTQSISWQTMRSAAEHFHTKPAIVWHYILIKIIFLYFNQFCLFFNALIVVPVILFWLYPLPPKSLWELAAK